MKTFMLLLIIVAILCALFANQIDTAVNGKQQVRKVILVFSIGVSHCCGSNALGLDNHPQTTSHSKTIFVV